MSKIDFKKTLKHLYAASSKKFEVVEVPALQYLMIDGHGDPNTALEYKSAIETLYPLAYRLKFMSKEQGKDYVVPPMEGLWWADDYQSFAAREKDKWDWTVMLMTPDWITRSNFELALEDVTKKKNPPSIGLVRLEQLNEGLCVQRMHIGSYDDEAATLAELHNEWLPSNGYTETGKHHEIYLSDPRRTEASKLKTILRQPIKSP